MVAGLPPPVGGDASIGWTLEVGATVTFICAFIVISLRAWARYKYSHLDWDDYLMIFAIIQALLATIFDFVSINWGFGRHLFYLTQDEASHETYYDLLAQVFCIDALTWGKLSICVSYLRLIRGANQRWLRIFICFIGALVFVVNTVVMITSYVACDPPAKSWNQSIPGTCWKMPIPIIIGVLQGSFSALTDFILGLIPFLLFKKLNVAKRAKYILIGLMSLGLVAGCLALVRTVQIGLPLNPALRADQSWNNIQSRLWGAMERNIAIMAASVPALRPLAAPFMSFASRSLGSKPKVSEQQSYEMWRPDNFVKISQGSSAYSNSGVYPSRTPMKNNTTYGSKELILPLQKPDQV